MKNDPVINKNQTDTLMSTYWWVMILDGNHPQNNPRVPFMHGYSKFQYHDEAKDKLHMLMRKIQMLVNNGYHLRAKQIIIHKRAGDIIDKSRDPVIVVLYKGDFSIGNEFVSDKNYLPLSIYLRKLYAGIRNKEDVSNLLPKRRASFSKDDYLDVNKHVFNSINQLDHYCLKLAANAHPPGAILNFKIKYLEKYPHLESKNNT